MHSTAKKQQPQNVTIFYENSFGIMCQWTGQMIGRTEKTVDIRFSKTKANRYTLANSRFMLITKTPMKAMPGIGEDFCFSDEQIKDVLLYAGDNVAFKWHNGQMIEN